MIVDRLGVGLCSDPLDGVRSIFPEALEASLSRKNSSVLDSKLVLAGLGRPANAVDRAVDSAFVACALLSSNDGLDDSDG